MTQCFDKHIGQYHIKLFQLLGRGMWGLIIYNSKGSITDYKHFVNEKTEEAQKAYNDLIIEINVQDFKGLAR